jgi:hypothetical protein
MGCVCVRVIEACLATLVSVAIIFLLPHFFGQCLPMQDEQKGDEYWFQYTCPKVNTDTGVAYYNDLATLFFSVPHQTIQQLLALVGGENSPFTIPSLAIHSGSFLFLFILAYGIATPGGIFMPSIMVCTMYLGKEPQTPKTKNSPSYVYVINY